MDVCGLWRHPRIPVLPLIISFVSCFKYLVASLGASILGIVILGGLFPLGLDIVLHLSLACILSNLSCLLGKCFSLPRSDGSDKPCRSPVPLAWTAFLRLPHGFPEFFVVCLPHGTFSSVSQLCFCAHGRGFVRSRVCPSPAAVGGGGSCHYRVSSSCSSVFGWQLVGQPSGFLQEELFVEFGMLCGEDFSLPVLPS